MMMNLAETPPKHLVQRLSSRQAKGIRCVALCRPKAYVTTGHAHRGRLASTLVVTPPLKRY